MNGKVKMWTREHKRWLSQFQRCTCVLGVWGALTGWALSPPWLGFPRHPALRAAEHSWQLSGSTFGNRVLYLTVAIQAHSCSGRAAWHYRWWQPCQPLSNELSWGLAASPCFSFHLTLLKMARCRAQPWGMLVVLFWLALSSCFQNSQFVTKENEQCPLKQFEVCHDGL